MKKEIKTSFQNWELDLIIICSILLIIILPIEFFCECITARFPVLFSVITGLLIGIITTILILYFQRRHRQEELSKHYRKIEGNYIRFDIGQDNTPKSDVKSLDDIPHPSEINKDRLTIQEDNRKLPIVITYEGENTFTILADYWYSLKCKVKATVEFSETNKLYAHGRYLYIEGKLKGNFGTYTIYRFDEDDNKLLVLYQHIYPREDIDNPDKNRGWEIWQKDTK